MQVSQKKGGELTWAEIRHPPLTTCASHHEHLTSSQQVTLSTMYRVHLYTVCTPFHTPCHDTQMTAHAGYIICTQCSMQRTSSAPDVAYRSRSMCLTAHTGHLMGSVYYIASNAPSNICTLHNVHALAPAH